MAYTTIDKPSDYFETVTYTGNGGTNSISSLDFQPDWLWIKCRSNANGSNIFDVLRGTNSIHSDTNGAQADRASDGFTSLDNDGFTLNGSGSGGSINVNTRTYAAWNWKAGTSLNNSAGSNNGSIASTGSFSTTAGFSVVKWSGSDAAGTIYTGLSGKIDFVILKNLSTTRNWIVKPKSFAANDILYLQETSATVNAPGDGWIDVLTATNGTIGLVAGGSNTNPVKNVSEDGFDYIAYCFQKKQGFSSFGSYEGNGNADGTFVYTGFKPAWVLTKSFDSTSNWELKDSTRAPFNTVDDYVKINTSAAEDTGVSSHAMDFLSNGFKHRGNNDEVNGSETYIYLAFAENPFVTSTGVPATAR